MANESLITAVDHLIDPIWENVLDIMRERFVMTRLCRTFNDARGMTPRKVEGYVDDSNAVSTNLGEIEDLTATQLERDLRAMLTPEEIGKQYVVSDRRVETDKVGVIADAARMLGYSLGKQVEKYMLGHVLDFTLSTYGSASNRAGLDMLYWARTVLDDAGVMGPYYTVMHPYQFRDIHGEMVDVSKGGVLPTRELFDRQYYVAQVADFNIIVSPNVPRVLTTGRTWAFDLGGATGGTFALNVDGEITGSIDYDAVEATIVAALNALTGVTSGDLVVDTDAPPSGYAFTVTAAANLINSNISFHIYSEGLTGYTEIPHVTQTSDGAGYFAGGMWAQEALAFDLRRGVRVEPERDASKRLTELNGTMIFGHGAWLADYGVQLRSQATLRAPVDPWSA